MRKLLALSLLAGALIFPNIVGAATQVTAVPPQQPNGEAWGNAGLLGVGPYVVSVSTAVNTPVLLISGQGILYGVEASSGAATGFCVGFDAASTSGITSTTTFSSAINPSNQITPQVFTSAQVAADYGYGHWDTSAAPVQFTKGLVGLTSNSTAGVTTALNCIFKARAANVGVGSNQPTYAVQPNGGP